MCKKEECKMTMGRIKVLLLCCYLILAYNGAQSESNVSTACYGVPTIGCTDHRLICIEPMVISVTNITFGYRRGCSVVGVPNCINTACCSEETGDCFTPFNPTLLSQLQQTCNGRSTCVRNRDNGLDESSSSCFNGVTIFHSYSKIEYQCTKNISSSNPNSFFHTTSPPPRGSDDSQADGDDGGTNVGGIVGGIVGVILVIGIVGAVIFFYIRRDKKTKAGHPRRNVPNQRYQTDSALARNITLHYADIDNTACSSRTNPSTVVVLGV